MARLTLDLSCLEQLLGNFHSHALLVNGTSYPKLKKIPALTNVSRASTKRVDDGIVACSVTVLCVVDDITWNAFVALPEQLEEDEVFSVPSVPAVIDGQ
jgi:hypothetical protein